METYKRIALGLVFLLFSCSSNDIPNNTENSKERSPQDTIPLEIDNNRSKSSLPRSIEISMKLYDTKDLKVKSGDRVKAGQVIGDRSLERDKLLYQKSQLQTQLSRLSADSLYIPILPIAKLPEPNYEVQKANVSLAEYNLNNAKLQHENQKEKISKLRSMKSGRERTMVRPYSPQRSEVSNSELVRDNTKPSVIQDIDAIVRHEEAILNDIRSKVENAEIKLNLAKSRLSNAKQDRKYKEYLHQLEIYKRSVNLSRQKLELARQEEKVNYQKSQIKSQISQIDNQILQLTEVRSPYDGTIKKIKWAGQSDNIINVVVTLSVESNSSE